MANALRVLTAVALAAASACSQADPITLSGVFNIREQRTINSLGIGVGDRVRVGVVSVTPNGAFGTTGVATQGAATLPMLFQPSGAAPDFFNNATSNTSLTGPWKLTFTNGTDVTEVFTQSAAATPPPFVRSVTISGSGTEPTISWEVPGGFISDGTIITIYDKALSDQAGFAVGIYSAGIAATETSFAVPAGVLSLDRPDGYVFEVRLVDLRDPLGPISSTNTEGSSRSFFGFNPLAPGSPDDVYLPLVDAAGVFHFDFDVTADTRVFIDPLVAIGYDYAIGAGDPNFTSVTLPDVGDGLYDLLLFNGSDWIFSGILAAGQQYFFAAGGVSSFRIEGIEASAGLAPDDPLAFVTGLTFAADGRFTGTMTPLVVFASVPEPGTPHLLALSLGGLWLMRRRRRARSRPTSA